MKVVLNDVRNRLKSERASALDAAKAAEIRLEAAEIRFQEALRANASLKQRIWSLEHSNQKLRQQLRGDIPYSLTACPVCCCQQGYLFAEVLT